PRNQVRQKRSRKSITQGTKRGDVIDSKSPEGTRRLGPPFPIKSTQGFTNPSTKSILKRRTEGEEHRGGGLGERTIHGRVREGVFIPAGPVRPVCWTGQTGWLDRSDRCQGSVKPVGLQHPLYTISSDGRGSFFETKSSPRCRRLDGDPVRGFGGSAKPE